jgi:hypothetical protein
MTGRTWTWLYSAAALALIMALGGTGNIASASFPDTLLLVLGTVGSVLGAGIPVQQFTPQAASTSTASRWC